MTDLSVADIKALLVERLDALIHELAPRLRKHGPDWQGLSPLRAGDNPNAFYVWGRGTARGAWKDFVSGEAGDALDLIAFLRCGAVGKPSRDERVAAIKWAKDWLGIAKTDRAALEKARAMAHARAKEAEERAAKARAFKKRRAFELWLKGRPIFGTLAETYLRERGIELSAVDDWDEGLWDDGLRFLPNLDHWKEKWRGPAMLAAFRHPRHGFSGLHATFLRADGKGKADVEKPKLMLGSVKGAAIRLTRGESRRTLAEAEACGVASTLVLGEGIETVLSVAAAVPEYRCWAAGSLDNIGEQPGSPAISAYLLLADNDVKPAARAAFDKAQTKIARHGKPVMVARSHVGNDMNNLAQLGAA
ncbi:MAG: DUF7146 domain-containing protein [Methylocystis sp.]